MIIWDEYKYGEEVFNKCEVKTKRWQNNELKCLIKYLIKENKPNKVIREYLIKCCNDDIRYLNDNQIKEIFNKLIYQAKREPLVMSKEVIIYKDEINTIKSLMNENLERILFVMLVYNKWVGDGNMEWFAILRSDILKESKLKNINYNNFQKMLTELNGTKLVSSDVKLVGKNYRRSHNKHAKQMWKVNFLKADGEVAFAISDYVNVVYRYLGYVYGGYFQCEVCGGMFEKKSEAQKYCKKCGKYQPIKTKTITCIDCGKEVEVDSLDNQTRRCGSCYEKYRREYYKIKKREQRKK